MRLSVAILALCTAHCVYSQDIFSAPANLLTGADKLLDGIFGNKTTDPCSRDVLQDYQKAITAFHNKLYTNIAARSGNHFVFSSYTIWLSLSALAEGGDPSVQSQLFTSLNLPQERCIRKKFYDIALNVEQPGSDVSLKRVRSLFLDDSIKVYLSWDNIVRSNRLLNFAYSPIIKDPQTTSNTLRQFMGAQSDIVLSGNSILLDALDYEGLWTTAFDDVEIKPQPFFNEMGQQVGKVDMMKMKKKVRLAHVPFMSAKVLELPVGTQGRYTMLIAVGTGDDIIKNAINIFMGSILEIFSLLQTSLFPMDIAIPRFGLMSEFNARPALEEIGVRGIWRDPAATRYVSNPPATPGGLIQRVSVKFDSHGVESAPAVGTDILSGLRDVASRTATGVATALGHEFTANRPFMFALFDTKTHTCLYAGAFSRLQDE